MPCRTLPHLPSPVKPPKAARCRTRRMVLPHSCCWSPTCETFRLGGQDGFNSASMRVPSKHPVSIGDAACVVVMVGPRYTIHRLLRSLPCALILTACRKIPLVAKNLSPRRRCSSTIADADGLPVAVYGFGRCRQIGRAVVVAVIVCRGEWAVEPRSHCERSAQGRTAFAPAAATHTIVSDRRESSPIAVNRRRSPNC